MSIANSTVGEGNSGTRSMTFTVALSKASDKTVTVGYTTANGTATAGQDYTATGNTHLRSGHDIPTGQRRASAWRHHRRTERNAHRESRQPVRRDYCRRDRDRIIVDDETVAPPP